MSSETHRPLAVTLYHFKELYGHEPDLDEHEEKAEKQENSLWRLKREASSEARSFAQELVELTTCPHCSAEHPIEAEDIPYANFLCSERDRLLRAAELYGREIGEVERITDPDLMGEAFQILEKQFNDNKSWFAFLGSARSARRDYSMHRRIAKQAKQLSTEIANTAGNLARIIRALQDTGLMLPDNLMPILKKDELYPLSTSEVERELQIRRLIKSVQRRKGEQAQKSPDLVTLLNEVARACEMLVPDFMDPAIHAATSTRQNSKKTAYLRAFAEKLHESQIDITAETRRAMAITGNAIFDDAELTITEDDVRKALLPQNPARHNDAAPKKKDKSKRKTRLRKSV